jgi:hypothetical protein
MKDGSTHMAVRRSMRWIWKTGAVVAVTLQAADQGDTTTVHQTLAEAGEAVATLIERETERRPEATSQVHIHGIQEIVPARDITAGRA